MKRLLLLMLLFSTIAEANEDWFKAAQEGKTETMAQMLDRNEVDINLQNADGDTALILTLKYLQPREDDWFGSKYKHGNLDAPLMLIKRQADVNLPNNDGHTPLSLAITYESVEVFDALIKKANWHCQSGRKDYVSADGEEIIGGDSPLHLAIQVERPEWVEMFAKDPVLLTMTDNIRRTPFHIAARMGNDRALRILIDAASNLSKKNYQKLINTVDSEGFTALAKAVQKNEAICAGILLEAGAKKAVMMGDVNKDPAEYQNLWSPSKYDPRQEVERKLQDDFKLNPEISLKEFVDMRAKGIKDVGTPDRQKNWYLRTLSRFQHYQEVSTEMSKLFATTKKRKLNINSQRKKRRAK